MIVEYTGHARKREAIYRGQELLLDNKGGKSNFSFNPL